MKIQQHDGVVVDAGRHSSRASPRLRGRDVTGGDGGARGWCEIPPLPPTIYRGARGGAGPSRWHLLGGAAAKGRFPSFPRHLGVPSTTWTLQWWKP